MSVLLKVEERAVRPRSLRKKLRQAGRIPAVVYGNGITNLAVSVDAKDLYKNIRENGHNAVYTLEVNGEKIPTLILAKQLDTFTRDWLHIEFLAVDMNEETELDADIVLVGTPAGVKVGGTLDQPLHSVTVLATPDNIPENVTVDVSKLEIGDSLTVADIPKNDKYKIVTDPEEQIAAVEMIIQEVEDDTDDTAVAEPEVIGEKATEE